ncbi:MAG: ABC transporter permease [Acidimicrobiia bacterium]
MSRRNWGLARRNMGLMYFTITQPIMFVLLFAYVIGAIASDMGDWSQYFVPGVVAQSITFAAGATAVGISEDRRRGMTDRFRSMPIALTSIIIGRILFDTLRIAAVVGVTVITGYVVGFSFRDGVASAVLFFAVSVLFGAAISFLGAAVGVWASNTETAQASLYSWMYPMTFISSALVVPDRFPPPLKFIAQNNPVSFLADTLRALANGSDFSTPMWKTAVAALCLVVVFCPLSIRMLSRRMSR